MLSNHKIKSISSVQFSSVQFSHSVVSDSLRPHESQHARPPCPSPTPGVHSNSCPLSQWCHPTISSSVVPFSSRLQSFPASGSFQMSQLFTSGDAFELWCWRRLLRVPWTARRSNQSILKEISPNIHWKDWCWSWNSNTLATWCEELTHWKRPWCWERLKAGRQGDNRRWDG